jgi:NDP-hexose 4-ketoreductase
MEIVGNGFLAHNLRPMSHQYPYVVVLAAGVSSASGTSDAEFAREAELLRKVAYRCKRTGQLLVFFSTASAGMYGATDGLGTEDRPVNPSTPYGAHKRSLEEQLHSYGTDYIVLRLGHIVGPGQPPHQLIPALVRQIRNGSVRIDRGAVRDLIGVADAVTIIDWLLGRDLRGETVNVASGTAVPVEQIVDHLVRRLGVVPRRQYRDVGSPHTVSIEKLQALVPEVATLGFGPGYYRRVLDSFTPSRTSTGSGTSTASGTPVADSPPPAPSLERDNPLVRTGSAHSMATSAPRGPSEWASI